MSERRPIVVIGAGLAGLSAALRLRAQHDVVVLEASNAVGGKLRSEEKQGYLFEWGPHSFLGSAQNMFSLIELLGIDHALIQANESSRKRYVYHGNSLRTVPHGPVSFITSSLLSPMAKARALMEPWLRPRNVPQETAARFFARRFGRRVAERLVAPFVSGIYAGDANELEMDSAFPRLVALERDHGSVLIGAIKSRGSGPRRKGSFSFTGGMQTLADSAAVALGDRIRRRSAVRRLIRVDDCWQVEVADGTIIETGHVVMTVPSPAAARILSSSRAGEKLRSVGGLLATIPYASVGLVQLGCARSQLPRQLDGFGFLSTPDSKLPILGSLWPSAVFPGRAPNGKALLSVFLGGRTRGDLASSSPAELIDLARASVGKALGGSIEPDVAEVRWIDRAIPQYVRGHQRKVDHIVAQLRDSGLTLAGNYLNGISVDQAVASGAAAAESIARESNS